MEREPRETVNDRNDRAIRKAVSWYESHISESQKARSKNDRVRVLLLTEDAANRDKAINEGLIAATGEVLFFRGNFILFWFINRCS